MNYGVNNSHSKLTGEQTDAAYKLARIYNLVSRGKRVNPYTKDLYYAMAAKHPEIHYAALAINKRRRRR